MRSRSPCSCTTRWEWARLLAEDGRAWAGGGRFAHGGWMKRRWHRAVGWDRPKAGRPSPRQRPGLSESVALQRRAGGADGGALPRKATATGDGLQDIVAERQLRGGVGGQGRALLGREAVVVLGVTPRAEDVVLLRLAHDCSLGSWAGVTTSRMSSPPIRESCERLKRGPSGGALPWRAGRADGGALPGQATAAGDGLQDIVVERQLRGGIRGQACALLGREAVVVVRVTPRAEDVVLLRLAHDCSLWIRAGVTTSRMPSPPIRESCEALGEASASSEGTRSGAERRTSP